LVDIPTLVIDSFLSNSLKISAVLRHFTYLLASTPFRDSRVTCLGIYSTSLDETSIGTRFVNGNVNQGVGLLSWNMDGAGRRWNSPDGCTCGQCKCQHLSSGSSRSRRLLASVSSESCRRCQDAIPQYGIALDSLSSQTSHGPVASVLSLPLRRCLATTFPYS